MNPEEESLAAFGGGVDLGVRQRTVLPLTCGILT